MSQQPLDYFAPRNRQRPPVLEGSAVTLWTMSGIIGLNALLFAASATNGLIAFFVVAFVAKFLNVAAAVAALCLWPWARRVSSTPVAIAHAVLSVLLPLAGNAAVESIVMGWLPRC